MRARVALAFAFLFFTTSLFAKEVWIAVSGSANGFFSDARVFNPTDHEITVQATYFPRGNNDNTAITAKSFTVPSRQMKVLDDIVSVVLQGSGIGAIRFVSPDDFVATQRVYAATDCDPSAVNLPCTTGQFVQGQDVAAALKKGVILQLKDTPAFRTNVGAANTSTSVAHVTWKLYDKNNATVATRTDDLQPLANIGPDRITSFFSNSTADLSDAWVGFVSDQPILAYGSVIDNVSTDATYVPASNDSGTAPTAKSVTITARNFAFTVSTSGSLSQNDSVTFKVSQTEGSHGFQLVDPDGSPVITLNALTTTVVERTVTLAKKGTYFFFCTNSSCGIGHTSMTGSINVGSTGTPGPPDGY